MEVPGATNFHKPGLFFPSITNPLDPSTKYLQCPGPRHFYCLTTGSLYQQITPTNQLPANLYRVLQKGAQLPLPLKQPTTSKLQEPSKIIAGSPKQADAASKTPKKKEMKRKKPKKNLKEKTQVKPDTPKEKPSLSTQDKIVENYLKKETQVKHPSPKKESALSFQNKIVNENLKKKTKVKRSSPKKNNNKPASGTKKKKVKNTKTKIKPVSSEKKPAVNNQDKIDNKRKKLRQAYRKIKAVPVWTYIKPFNRRPRPKKKPKRVRKSSSWGRQLKDCIMASSVHEIVHSQFAKYKKVHKTQSQLRALLNLGNWKLRTDQDWMKHMEKEAISKYKKMYFDKHKKRLKVKNNIVFRHPEKPWLVSVCRTVINKDEKESWPLLVKCLYKYPDSTLRHASKHRSFCLTWDDISYSLRKDHAYYTQIQCHMAITDTLYAELLVHTNKETAFVRVYFDCDFWEEKEDKLEAFYKIIVLPYLSKDKTEPNLNNNLSEQLNS